MIPFHYEAVFEGLCGVLLGKNLGGQSADLDRCSVAGLCFGFLGFKSDEFFFRSDSRVFHWHGGFYRGHVLGTFRVFPGKAKKSPSEVSDSTREIWSGRPGSNRRRPAWEAGIQKQLRYTS